MTTPSKAMRRTTIALVCSLAFSGCGKTGVMATLQSVPAEGSTSETAMVEPPKQSLDFTISEYDLTKNKGPGLVMPTLDAPIPEVVQPEMPPMPMMPGMENMPSMPGFPGMAGMPTGLPGMLGGMEMPGMPGLPGIPGGAEMPRMPGVNDLAKLAGTDQNSVTPNRKTANNEGEPQVAQAPHVPSLPPLMKAPEMPRLPAPPDMRRIMLESMRASQTGVSLPLPISKQPAASQTP